MRAFFRSIIWILLIFIILPFAAGFIIRLGSGIDYFLAVISASLFFIGLLFLIRGRILGLFIIFLSVISLAISKHVFHLNMFNNPFWGPYGTIHQSGLLMVLIVVYVISLIFYVSKRR